MSILKDLRKGKEAEDFVCFAFQEAGIKANVVNQKGHDLLCKIAKQEFHTEVKFDLYSKKSGNVAVEYHNSNQDKPSGINATTAGIWVYVFPGEDNNEPGEAWLVSANHLKEVCENNTDAAPIRYVDNAGDGNAHIILFKKDDILKQFTRIDNMGKNNLRKLIRESL